MWDRDCEAWLLPSEYFVNPLLVLLLLLLLDYCLCVLERAHPSIISNGRLSWCYESITAYIFNMTLLYSWWPHEGKYLCCPVGVSRGSNTLKPVTMMTCYLQVQWIRFCLDLEWHRGEQSYIAYMLLPSFEEWCKFVPGSLIILMNVLARIKFGCKGLKQQKQPCFKLDTCLFCSHFKCLIRRSRSGIGTTGAQALSNLLLLSPSLRLPHCDSRGCFNSSHHVHIPSSKKETRARKGTFHL